MTIYVACLINGIVKNVIVCLSADYTNGFKSKLTALYGYDTFVDVTSTIPRPGPRWTYSGGTFTDPNA
jgi:hypothetical protein